MIVTLKYVGVLSELADAVPVLKPLLKRFMRKIDDSSDDDNSNEDDIIDV